MKAKKTKQATLADLAKHTANIISEYTHGMRMADAAEDLQHWLRKYGQDACAVKLLMEASMQFIKSSFNISDSDIVKLRKQAAKIAKKKGAKKR